MDSPQQIRIQIPDHVLDGAQGALVKRYRPDGAALVELAEDRGAEYFRGDHLILTSGQYKVL